MEYKDAEKLKVGDIVYPKGGYTPLTILGKVVGELPEQLAFCVRTNNGTERLVKHTEIYILPAGYIEHAEVLNG